LQRIDSRLYRLRLKTVVLSTLQIQRIYNLFIIDISQGEIMKLFVVLMLLIVIVPVSSQKVTTFVNDYADVLSEQDEAILSGILNQIYQSGEVEYSVVTVKSLEGEAIEAYSLRLAQGNLGNEDNNGLLLLVAIEDQKYRFEVGRGIEYMLNDAKVGRIGRTYLVPNFQNGAYNKGIIEASLAVRSIFLNETESEYYVSNVPQEKVNIGSLIYSIFIFLFIISSFIPAFNNTRRKNKYFNAAMAAINFSHL